MGELKKKMQTGPAMKADIKPASQKKEDGKKRKGRGNWNKRERKGKSK